MKKILLAAVAIAAIAVSCVKPEPENPGNNGNNENNETEKPVTEEVKLELKSEAAVNVAAEGATVEVSFVTNADWTAKGDADWVSIQPAQGKASEQVQKANVTVAANETEAARSAKVTVKAGDKEVEVVISQEGKPAAPATKEIMTVEQFEEFADSVNAGKSIEKWIEDGVIKLGADLDFTGKNHTPIGTASNRFMGVFDGQGHVIKNLKYTTPGTEDIQHQGIFGAIGEEDGSQPAVVKNFTVDESCSFEGSLSGETTWVRVAACVGYVAAGSSIDNLVNKAEVTIVKTGAKTAKRLGGVVASSKGAVTNCKNYGRVWYDIKDYVIAVSTSNYSFGGVAGYVGDDVNAKVENCVNYGNVEINFVEPSQRVTAAGAANNAKGNSNVGGVVGSFSGVDGKGIAEMKNCQNEGNVLVYGEGKAEAWSRVGGVVGYAVYATVSDCINRGEVKLDNGTMKIRIGGVIGYLNSKTGTRSIAAKLTNLGKVTVTNTAKCTSDGFFVVGGVLGLEENFATMSEFTNEGEVNVACPEKAKVGGVLGSMGNTATLSASINKGTVTTANHAAIGGILGWVNNKSVAVSDCKMQGKVVLSASQDDANGGDYQSGIVAGHYIAGATFTGIKIAAPAAFAVGTGAPVAITADNFATTVVKSSDYTDKNVHIKAVAQLDSLEGISYGE